MTASRVARLLPAPVLTAVLLLAAAPQEAQAETRYVPEPLMALPAGATPFTADASGRVFFGASNTLWMTDDTADGTQSIKDLGATVWDLTPAGAASVVVSVDLAGTDWELWVSDGTADGTEVIVDAAAATPTTFAGGVLFWTRPDADSLTLARFVPGEGTTDLHTFQPLAGDADAGVTVPEAAPLYLAGQSAWFAQPYLHADEGASDSLWSVAADGTVALVDVYAEGSLSIHGSQPTSGALIYTAWTHADGVGSAPSTPLYAATDATATRVHDPTAPDEAVAAVVANVGAWVLFELAGGDLWRTDGTVAGTEVAFALATTPAIMAADFPGVRFQDWIYWPDTGSLWRTDGDHIGTVINPKGGIGDAPGGIGVWSGSDRVWWWAIQSGGVTELHASDGTTAGRQLALGKPELSLLDGPLRVIAAIGATLYTEIGGQLVAIRDTGETHPCPVPVLDVGELELTVAVDETFTLTASACHPGGAPIGLSWGVTDGPADPVLSATTGETIDVTMSTPGEYTLVVIGTGSGIDDLRAELLVTVEGAATVDPGPDDGSTDDGTGTGPGAEPAGSGGSCGGGSAGWSSGWAAIACLAVARRRRLRPCRPGVASP